MAVKTNRGGKYSNQLYADGYFGRHDAGQPRQLGQGGAPTKREFVGSNLKEYIFSDETHGTRTIVAENYQDAVRIAETLGFTKADYKKRRRIGR